MLASGDRDVLHDVACLVARRAAPAEGPIADDGLARFRREGPRHTSMRRWRTGSRHRRWLEDWGHTATEPDLKPLHGRRELSRDGLRPHHPRDAFRTATRGVRADNALRLIGRGEPRPGGRPGPDGGRVGADVGVADVPAAGAFGPGFPSATSFAWARRCVLDLAARATLKLTGLSGHWAL